MDSIRVAEALAKLAFVDAISSEGNDISRSTRKRASVLVPILPNGTVLLTQRAARLRSHGGQVCFPGGQQDPEDDGDDVQTALRETHEEVGLRSVRPIGRLPALVSQHGLCVTPIIGVVMDEDDSSSPQKAALVDSLVVSKDEVDAVFVVPLDYFADDTNLRHPVEIIEWHDSTFALRTYDYTCENQQPEQRVFTIWGLTAYIAHQVASIATFHGAGRLHRYFAPLQHATGHTTARWQRGHFRTTTPPHPHAGAFLIHEEEEEEKQLRRGSNQDGNDSGTTSSSSSSDYCLSLKHIHVTVDQEETGEKDGPAHTFQVHDLDSGGQILWRLAAEDETQRLQWIAFINWSSMKLSRQEK
jgi:8-oxo-dGTP pyrophosphatase MutT (NUDIX family)